MSSSQYSKGLPPRPPRNGTSAYSKELPPRPPRRNYTNPNPLNQQLDDCHKSLAEAQNTISEARTAWGEIPKASDLNKTIKKQQEDIDELSSAIKEARHLTQQILVSSKSVKAELASVKAELASAKEELARAKAGNRYMMSEE